MSVLAVKKYLSSDVKAPYFYVVGDSQYNTIKEELSEIGFSFVRISSLCREKDKLPNLDNLFEQLRTADLNIDSKKLVVIGLGEFLALRGKPYIIGILSRLRDLNIGSAKVVLLLRGVAAQVKSLQEDPRFDKRRLCVSNDAKCELSITVTNYDPRALQGFKALLVTLENGSCGNIAVNTNVNLDNALLTVYKIPSAYAGIRCILHNFNLPSSCGRDDHWAELLTELSENNNSFDALLQKHGLDGYLETDFYTRIAGNGYRNWFYFIALKIKADVLGNSYLRFVLNRTNQFEDFKSNVLNAIIEVAHTDDRFKTFYNERKKLVAGYPESEVAKFVASNRRNAAQSIYRLTDNTRVEREEIIAWVSRYGLIPEIAEIYPALNSYMKLYVFNCGHLSSQLTEYFQEYKRQKLSNTLDADFLTKVEHLAETRLYNQLPTRNEVMERIEKDDTYLYWLDSFGVEYLALVVELARKYGLSASIKIARAELPTITSLNRDFFDTWAGAKKEKNNDLDETKHAADVGGYNFEINNLPIHLAKELDIISEVFEKAATELAMHHCKRFLIVSDHGASRLAVLRRKEEKYETDTKGEHSGRCCEYFEPYNLPFAAEENGYLVLADYGRFKGSRAANVEVHGGASLEEVLVPIIELTLKDSNIIVEMLEEFATVDFRKGIEITLFSNCPLKNVSIVINEKRYLASPLDQNHFKVELVDIRRAGEYTADVFSGDDLVGEIIIKAHGKSAKINDAFDELF